MIATLAALVPATLVAHACDDTLFEVVEEVEYHVLATELAGQAVATNRTLRTELVPFWFLAATIALQLYLEKKLLITNAITFNTRPGTKDNYKNFTWRISFNVFIVPFSPLQIQ